MRRNQIQYRKIKDWLLAVISIILFYFALSITGIGCPIKFLTGISCPGCGMTRAYIALLHLDFKDAFYYHPLWPLPIVWGVLWVAKTFHASRTDSTTKRWEQIYIWFCRFAVAAFLITYLIRMQLPNQNIVVFNPTDGFIVRRLKNIIQYFN